MGRLRVTRRYVWRPSTAAQTDRCAGGRKVLVRVTARARASLVAALRRQSDGTQEQSARPLRRRAHIPACVPAYRRHICFSQALSRNHNDHQPPPTQAVTPHGLALRCSFPVGRACLPVRPAGAPHLRRLRRRSTATQPRVRQAVQGINPPCTALASVSLFVAVKAKPCGRCAALTEQAPAAAQPFLSH